MRIFTDRPKLLCVLAADVYGGAEVQTHALLAELAGRFRITLLTQAAIAGRFRDLPLTLIEFESFGLSTPYGYHWRNILAYGRAIARVARAGQADVVHAVMHNSSLFLAMARRRHPLALRGRLVTGSLHGSLLGYFRQRSAPPTLAESLAIRGVIGSLDAIATPSLGVARELVEAFGARKDRVHPIHNGFDLEAIRKLALEGQPVLPPKEGPWVVTCCRLSEQKDFETLLKGFAGIRPFPAAKLVILGDGPRRTAIEGWIHREGLEGRVLMAGFQPNPFAWIRQADVFVLSSFYEGFGNVIVEALALGIPVVASDCPWGPAEIIEPGVSGYLFEVGDAPSLTRCLVRLLADAALRERMTKAALQRAEGFSRKAMAARYTDLFSLVITKRNA